MSSRVTSDLLLVGSLPAESTEAAFRAGAERFGDLVFALPDGETGPRAAWVGYEREALTRPHPDVEVVEETESPTGIPRHAYETPVFRLREGVTELRFGSWPRIDDAIASYEVFKALREAGVIPGGLRFQVGLPFPSSALNAFKADHAHDYPIAARGFEDLVARELSRLTAAVPPSELAIQWDMAYETQDIEGVLAWTSEGAWERFAGPVTRLTRLIPQDTLVGYHLCYGTFPEWPMYEARDYGVLVRMANFAVANSGRTVDWLHLAGPRYLRSEDRSFFRPLVDLEPGDARVFLGIVLPIDGVPYGAGTPPPRATCLTSASRCTAASAGSPAATAWRPCATTATSSGRSPRGPDPSAGKEGAPRRSGSLRIAPGLGRGSGGAVPRRLGGPGRAGAAGPNSSCRRRFTGYPRTAHSKSLVPSWP